MALPNRLETALAADEWRYPLAIGLPAGLLTVVLSWGLPGFDGLDGILLFVACLLVGYLFTSPTVPTSRVGFRTGYIVVLPSCTVFFFEMLLWIPTMDSPTWFRAATAVLTTGLLVVALALSGALGVILTALGAWIGDHFGNRQSRAAGN